MRETGDRIDARHRAYVIEAVHGRGASGTTYRATDPSSNRTLLLTEIDPRGLPDWKVVELFEREVQALKRVDHPRIPRFEDAFVCQGGTAVERDAVTGPVTFVLVQEYIAGRSLAARLRDEGPLSPREASRLF